MDRKDLAKMARLSGRGLTGLAILFASYGKIANSFVNDGLSLSNDLASQFSGDSSKNIVAGACAKAGDKFFEKTIWAAKWADKKLKD